VNVCREMSASRPSSGPDPRRPCRTPTGRSTGPSKPALWPWAPSGDSATCGILPVLNTPSLDSLFAPTWPLSWLRSHRPEPPPYGSSDMATYLMPGLHPMIKAGSAKVHTESFCIEDTRLACIETAKDWP